MAFQGLTPESLLDRSDSKNPATTCKGLTTSGRPCRRGLGITPGSSPNATPTKGPKGVTSDDDSAENAGVMAIIDSTNAAAFFCWQHKDQAQNLIAKIESQQRQEQQHSDLQRRRTRIVPLQKRSSIDTLVERVGVIDLDGDVNDREGDFRQARPNAGQGGSNRPVNVKVKKRDTLPVEWQGIQGPLMSVPEEVINEVAPEPRIQRRQSRSRSRSRFDQRGSRQERMSNMYVKPKPKSSWICCGSSNNDYNDDGPPVRRRERHEQRRPSRSQSRPRVHTSHPTSNDAGATSRPVPQAQIRPHVQMQERPQYQSDYNNRPSSSQRQQWQQQSNYSLQPQSTPTRQIPISTTIPTQNTTTSHSSPPHSQTTHFLSLIPPHLDPVTTSALLTELSKSFAKDDDAGYIYIYWLTPSSSSPNNPNNIDSEEDKPDDDIASTILDSDSDSDIDLTSEASYRPSHSRRRSKPGASHHHPQSKSTSKSTSTLRKAALTRYASTKTPNHQPNSFSTTTTPTKSHATPPKILLKIGRATNVHRRMTQWSKQCGQNITLVRYYPYQSSSSTSPPIAPSSSAIQSPSAAGRKVPHVNKVERLIHLELRGLGLGYGVGEKCGVCGRGHREWFEVEGSREGLRVVDGVVRRWVGWGERVGGDGGGEGG